ncbi:uL22 family ribosomal protein [Candidatus Vidania fulgoroideorum]
MRRVVNLLKNINVSPKKVRRWLVFYKKNGVNNTSLHILRKYAVTKIDKILRKLFSPLKGHDFIINHMFVTRGKAIKKIRYRAKGGSDKIIKRRSNIYLDATIR